MLPGNCHVQSGSLLPWLMQRLCRLLGAVGGHSGLITCRPDALCHIHTWVTEQTAAHQPEQHKIESSNANRQTRQGSARRNQASLVKVLYSSSGLRVRLANRACTHLSSTVVRAASLLQASRTKGPLPMNPHSHENRPDSASSGPPRGRGESGCCRCPQDPPHHGRHVRYSQYCGVLHAGRLVDHLYTYISTYMHTDYLY